MPSRLDQYERALLGEVVENPHDELTLSVYADWLLDHPDRAAQTRGEYIKLELAQAKAAALDERKDLHWQAYDLWWNHGESWLGPLYDAVDHFVYERGRLCIEISEETFVKHLPEEIEDAPAWEIVTDIVFRSCNAQLLQFLRRLPRPPMLTELDLPAGSIDAGEVAEWIASGFWDGLTGLSLDGNPLGDAGATALAEWPGLASLRRLSLDAASIGPAGAMALFRSPWLDEIEVLSLRRNSEDYQNGVRQSFMIRQAGASPASQLLKTRFGHRVRLK